MEIFMRRTKEKHPETLSGDAIFALDIGTRSIIGMVGVKENGRVRIIAIEKAEHAKRAMIDGQIEDINRVAEAAAQVKKKLEEQLGMTLNRVCVAAAGRALKTQRAVYEMELPEERVIGEELVNQLEAGAISKAEEAFEKSLGTEDSRQRFYLVGYTVCQYYLDDYQMATLKDHRGKHLKAELIATFLPSEVVGSLYAAMHKIGLEVASLTLEPIAAINAAIPENLRLLNLVLVDIGAGTSDIAACRDGSIVGYTMATIAGDEVTETIMREYLVDFQTAERMKIDMETLEEIPFTDVLGLEQSVGREKLTACIADTASRIVKEISDKILEVNGGPPSALFLAGGGSRLAGLKEGITEYLGLESRRVAIAGNNFKINAFSDNCEIENPEYATPLGIAVSAGLNLINDSFLVTLNGNPAKLFRNGAFNTRDILMMNGYGYQDMVGRSGQNLVVTVNGRRTVFYGSQPEPAVLHINGKEGKLSDTIQAGDSITFVPAQHGSPAQAQVKDIQNLPSGVKVKVNGKIVSRSTPLKNGDNISFATDGIPESVSGNGDGGEAGLKGGDLPLKTSDKGNISRPVAETLGTSAPDVIDAQNDTALPVISGKAAAQPKRSKISQKSDDGSVGETSNEAAPGQEKKTIGMTADDLNQILNDMASPIQDNKPTRNVATVRNKQEDNSAAFRPDSGQAETASSPIRNNTPSEMTAVFGKSSPGVTEASAADREEATEEDSVFPVTSINSITFQLNGSRLTLPKKENRTPYYLMDMLEYSGLDFKKISGNVVLKVNGMPGYFQQTLKAGDDISIYEEKP